MYSNTVNKNTNLKMSQLTSNSCSMNNINEYELRIFQSGANTAERPKIQDRRTRHG